LISYGKKEEERRKKEKLNKTSIYLLKKKAQNILSLSLVIIFFSYGAH